MEEAPRLLAFLGNSNSVFAGTQFYTCRPQFSQLQRAGGVVRSHRATPPHLSSPLKSGGVGGIGHFEVTVPPNPIQSIPHRNRVTTDTIRDAGTDLRRPRPAGVGSLGRRSRGRGLPWWNSAPPPPPGDGHRD